MRENQVSGETGFLWGRNLNYYMRNSVRWLRDWLCYICRPAEMEDTLFLVHSRPTRVCSADPTGNYSIAGLHTVVSLGDHVEARGLRQLALHSLVPSRSDQSQLTITRDSNGDSHYAWRIWVIFNGGKNEGF